MSKAKLFIENFIIYGFGGVINKLIPLIMIPIITRILPDSSYFGINDNTTTLVSIASYLALLGMYDAMYRMFFDKEDIEYRKRVCSTTFFFVLFVSILIFFIMILLKNVIADFFYGDVSLSYVVYIAAFSVLIGSTNTIISGPARMQNKRLIYVVMNALGPIISYSIALIMLNRGYYIISLPLAFLISVAINEMVFFKINYKWFSFKYIDYTLLKPMLKFAIPLMPNFLIYWLFSACDRLMITNICGLNSAGIYGIGSKLGTASQLIYTAFAGGWQYFAFSTMKDKNQVEDNSKIFEYLGIISFAATLCLCAVSYFIYDMLFTDEYLSGYIIAPYLFLAPLLQMLFQVCASQFSIIKKTWPNMFILLGGAVANIILNIILIPRIGIEGAAIATLCGYIISDIICVVVLNKIKLMYINKKFILCMIMFIVAFIMWRVFVSDNIISGLLLALILILIYLFIYLNDIRGLLKIKNKC